MEAFYVKSVIQDRSDQDRYVSEIVINFPQRLERLVQHPMTWRILIF